MLTKYLLIFSNLTTIVNRFNNPSLFILIIKLSQENSIYSTIWMPHLDFEMSFLYSSYFFSSVGKFIYFIVQCY